MKDKYTIRAYVKPDTDQLVEMYATKNKITKQAAYNNLILNCLDSEGNLREKIILTPEQLLGVGIISKTLGQSPVETIQDLINYAMFFLGTDLMLRDVLIYSMPLLVERFNDINPRLSKEVLNQIKNGKAALRYSDETSPDVEGG